MVTELNSGLYKHTYRGRFSGQIHLSLRKYTFCRCIAATKVDKAQTRRFSSDQEAWFACSKQAAEIIGCLKMRRTHSFTSVMASTTTQTMRRDTMKGDGEDTATTEMKAQSLGTALRTRQQTPCPQTSQEWELSYRDLQGREYCLSPLVLPRWHCVTRTNYT